LSAKLPRGYGDIPPSDLGLYLNPYSAIGKWRKKVNFFNEK
jgi:hypothetical protein